MKQIWGYISLACLLVSICSFICIVNGFRLEYSVMNQVIFVLAPLGLLGTMYFGVLSPETKVKRIMVWNLRGFTVYIFNY
ncbi:MULTISPECIES: hypothetical protein [Bacillus cereus group]|uniref:Uncharacterized protein n=1 Tax=Bacillus cereus TaxID=1396 RepID=A0A1S9U5J7_BACCE|nr:hypothetical protein [Bacillus cereus]OOR17525.1 hypothetical protein BW892_27400 [Bacillus cereus]